MTDHAINRAAPSSASGLLGTLSRLARNWRSRRAVTRLEEFDDYMLRDMGVTRTDVLWASGLPLTVNAALALEERSHRRRAGILKEL